MQKIVTNSIIAIFDILWLIVIFYFSIFVRESLNGIYLDDFIRVDFNNFAFVIMIIFFLMFYEKIYTNRFDFWQDTLKVSKAFFISFLITMSILSLTRTNLEYSRAFVILYFFIGMITLPILKRYTKKIIFKFDFFVKKINIIGNDEQKNIFKKEIKENWYLGQKYDEQKYKSVLIVSKGYSTDELNNIIQKYSSLHSEVYIVPYITDINYLHSNILEYSNIRLNTIQVQNKLLLPSNIYIKILFDYIVSIVCFPFFLLLHLMISIAIKLDSKGDIFFKQYRLGKDNKPFLIYKYRTMYENGEKILKDYLELNTDELSYYQQYHKYKNDPRITKIGKLLRSTSLDELPQFINVLRGEMSLIGPRPYMLSESEKLNNYKDIILKVRPGITGLWQVYGRNNLTFKERNELEVWYIKNWSLWSDMVIFIKTIKIVLLKVGAK